MSTSVTINTYIGFICRHAVVVLCFA